MKRNNSLLFAGLLLAFASLTGCDKFKPYNVQEADAQVHFIGTASQSYIMTTTPVPVFNIIIGATNVSDVDRTVTFNVASPSGAQAGREYTLGVTGNTLTIPAGETRVTIPVQGNIDYFRMAEKDTLIFTLKEPSVKVAAFSDTIRLVLRGPCFDSEIVLKDMEGNYTKTYENGSYGPYTSTVAVGTAVVTGTNTGRFTITNIYESAISASADVNFATVGNFTITVGDQATQYTSGGNRLYVRSTPSTTSTFTYCTPFLRVYFDLYTSAGLYDRWVTTMGR